MPVEVVPHLVPVTSSNVKAVGYDRPTQTLYVAFHGGGLYAYDGVPPRDHAAMMVASSKGRYLNAEVKPAYAFRKLDASSVLFADDASEAA